MTTYATVLDGEIFQTFTTHRAAAEAAAWLRNHPETRDRRLHGLSGNVSVRQVRRCEWTGELIVD